MPEVGWSLSKVGEVSKLIILFLFGWLFRHEIEFTEWICFNFFFLRFWFLLQFGFFFFLLLFWCYFQCVHIFFIDYQFSVYRSFNLLHIVFAVVGQQLSKLIIELFPPINLIFYLHLRVFHGFPNWEDMGSIDLLIFFSKEYNFLAYCIDILHRHKTTFLLLI